MLSVTPVPITPSPKSTLTVLPDRAGVPGPPDLRAIRKVASSVATGLMGATDRLVEEVSSPGAIVVAAADA